MKRGAYRTVRSNEVRIYGKIYHCREPLNGELDGKRFYFIRYLNTDPPLACLWGTETLAREVAKLKVEAEGRELKALEEEDERILAPDGSLNWYWWEAKENDGSQHQV